MQCRVCIPNRQTDGCSNILLRSPGAHPDHEWPRPPRPKSDPARCATTTPRCAGGAPRSAVGERNAATALPGNPGPTTTHSPSPQLVKVPSARTGDRPTSPRPVTPTRPAPVPVPVPGVAASVPARRRWAPVVPDARPPRPRYAFCLHAGEQYTNRRPAPGNARGNRAPHCTHSPIPNIVTRHGDARYFRRIRAEAVSGGASSAVSRSSFGGCVSARKRAAGEFVACLGRLDHFLRIGW